MKILETKRLAIEEASIQDAPFFFDLLNSPNWIKHIGDRKINTVSDAENYIRKSLIFSYQSNGFGLYKMMLKSTSKPIGICGFLQRDYLDHPDIGFAILPDHERNGYTFEATEALLTYGQTSLQFDTILAITTETNTASRKLLTKAGLKEVGKVQPKEDGDELLLYSL